MTKRLTTEQFIERAKSVHGENAFDYSCTEYVGNTEKVKIICKKCGYELNQPAYSHLRGYGCRKCSSKKLSEKYKFTNEQFVEKAKKVHGNKKFDYSCTEYVGYDKKVKIKCNDCGKYFMINPNSHLQGYGHGGCEVQKEKRRKSNVEQWIKRFTKNHGDKFDYSKLPDYISYREKYHIICKQCGEELYIFPHGHEKSIGCPKCEYNGTTLTNEQFIEKAKKVHGDKYDYSYSKYKSSHDIIIIDCLQHGEFQQRANDHLNGHGCPKCRIGGVVKTTYEIYKPQLEEIGIECRRNKEDENILETKCFYCDKWYVPLRQEIKNKISASKNIGGENNLYCSDKCKKACPTYGQSKYPKDFKIGTSREVQSSLRKLVLKRDNWTCQRCESQEDGLHCHHFEGILYNPIESADVDNCITLCKNCHKKAHKEMGCRYVDMQCKQ